MKKTMTKVLTLLFCAALMTTILTACGPKSVSGSVKITDGDVLDETALPFMSVGGSYAFNMMGITSNEYTLTVEDGKYTYHVVDWGNTDKSAGMYFHREYDIIGTATDKGNGSYELSAPSDVTVTVEFGASFAEYESVWGNQGTFTPSNDSVLGIAAETKGAFVAGTTATIKDGAVTFSVPG